MMLKDWLECRWVRVAIVGDETDFRSPSEVTTVGERNVSVRSQPAREDHVVAARGFGSAHPDPPDIGVQNRRTAPWSCSPVIWPPHRAFPPASLTPDGEVVPCAVFDPPF
jgi:hypothetical protein